MHRELGLCKVSGPKSIAELLLADLHELFEKEPDAKPPNGIVGLDLNSHTPTELFTKDILAALHDRDDRPWPEFGKEKKPITSPQLASLLRKLGVKNVGRTVRSGDETAKGYKREWLSDAFTRYLPKGMAKLAALIHEPNADDARAGTP